MTMKKPYICQHYQMFTNIINANLQNFVLSTWVLNLKNFRILRIDLPKYQDIQELIKIYLVALLSATQYISENSDSD